jgi:hypothetical protein
MLEDVIYDSQSMRRFMGINLLEEDVPDATTLLKLAICWRNMSSPKRCLVKSVILFQKKDV